MFITAPYSVAIIEGSTALQHQCKPATDRAKNNEPKRRGLLLDAIVPHLDKVMAATARRIQQVVVFDHPIHRPKFMETTVLGRQHYQQQQQPSYGSTPVPHPIPFSRTTPSPRAFKDNRAKNGKSLQR